jgi:hypothetical protein
MNPIRHGSHVRVGARLGVVVSRSKTHYGVKFSNTEVEYFAFAHVSI